MNMYNENSTLKVTDHTICKLGIVVKDNSERSVCVLKHKLNFVHDAYVQIVHTRAIKMIS